MLDIRFIRENVAVVREALQKRNSQLSFSEFLAFESERRDMMKKSEDLKGRRNTVSEEIGRLKRDNKDASAFLDEMRDVSDRIKELDESIRILDEKINSFILIIPNIPHSSVPAGKDETENVVARRWGEPREFDFPPLNHWDIAETLNIIDFDRAYHDFQRGSASSKVFMNFMAMNTSKATHFRQYW